MDMESNITVHFIPAAEWQAWIGWIWLTQISELCQIYQVHLGIARYGILRWKIVIVWFLQVERGFEFLYWIDGCGEVIWILLIGGVGLWVRDVGLTSCELWILRCFVLSKYMIERLGRYPFDIVNYCTKIAKGLHVIFRNFRFLFCLWVHFVSSSAKFQDSRKIW